jgi:phosphoenolpyruvate-protein kinase (PTS system EI component)
MNSDQKNLWQEHYEQFTIGKLHSGEFLYRCVQNVLEFDQTSPVPIVFVDHLDPELLLIFPYIQCMVTRKGSVLSHLSILAREYDITVFCADWPVTMPKSGRVNVNIKRNVISIC